MRLIYVNKVGDEWNNKTRYEFIFANNIAGVDGENWDIYPASGNPEPPDEKYVDKVGSVVTDAFSLICIQYSDTFSVWDAVDGVIALAWEDIREYELYPENRLKFFYGEDISSVTEKLYERDIIIDYKFDKNEATR